MQIAFLVAQESKCASWSVGVVIEKNDRIIATGYNGSPAGNVNCCDHCIDQGWAVRRNDGSLNLIKEHRMDHSAWSQINEVHAELNAILFAARLGTVSLDGATMYVTLSPCANCAKAIAQSGIKKVVYCEEYDQNASDWSKVLLQAGVEVFKLDRSKMKLINWENIKTEPNYHN